MGIHRVVTRWGVCWSISFTDYAHMTVVVMGDRMSAFDRSEVWSSWQRTPVIARRSWVTTTV